MPRHAGRPRDYISRKSFLYRARHRDTPLPVAQVVEQIAAEPKMWCTQPWRRGWHLIGRGDDMYYCMHTRIGIPQDFDPAPTLIVTVTPPDALISPLHCDAKQDWHIEEGKP